MKHLLLTGGKGLLGTEILKVFGNNTIINKEYEIFAPSHSLLDICDISACERSIFTYRPDVIIHAAAFTSPPRCDKNPKVARDVNIAGTINLLNTCEYFQEKGQVIKFVYISTDYVFDGHEAPYKPDDAINPLNKYAMTKAAGEFAVRTYNNHLVIRTSFCENIFPYDKAFVDQWTSRDYVDIIAPLILTAAISEQTGIIHIGTERKSVFELAQRRKSNIEKLSRHDVSFNVPFDTSFS